MLPRRPDVAGQCGGELDLGHDPEHSDQEAQLPGDRSLEHELAHDQGLEERVQLADLRPPLGHHIGGFVVG